VPPLGRPPVALVPVLVLVLVLVPVPRPGLELPMLPLGPPAVVPPVGTHRWAVPPGAGDARPDMAAVPPRT
jgi:hypothetical protein